MTRLIASLRYASRRLRAAPAFALFAVATLALAIGATTAVYSLVRVLTGPPPGVADPDSLVELYHFPQGSGPIMNFAWEDYQDLRARQSVFEGLTGWAWFRPPVQAKGRSETVITELVDGDYFRTLGVRAVLGRMLQPADDRPESSPAAVISASFWQRVLNADPNIVGQPLTVSGTTFEIAGVAAPEFQGMFNGGLLATSVWVPMTTAQRAFPEWAPNFAPNNRDSRWVFVRGRLRSNTSLPQAAAQVSAIAAQLDAHFPIGRDRSRAFRTPWSVSRHWGVRPLVGRILGVPPQLLRLIFRSLIAAITLVLLVACTNLANLTIARNDRRRAELAVRLALGASRGQIVAEAMIEPVLLAIAGGLGAVAVARVLMRMLSTAIPVGNGGILQALPHTDAMVLAAGAAATLLALLVAGVIPALQSARLSLRSAISAESSSVMPRWRGRRYLIAAQVTVSVVLVAASMLYAGELRRETQIDTGIDLDHLALAQVDFGAARYDEGRVRGITAAVVGRISAAPGVTHAAVMSGLPIGLKTTFGATLEPVGGAGSAGIEFTAATPGVFETLGVGMTRGRPFDARDTAGAPGVIVLSQEAARQVFGSESAVGRQVVFTRRMAIGEQPRLPATLTVIGIAEDTDAGTTGRRDRGVAYLPLAQHYEANLVFAARTDRNPRSLVPSLRAAISAVDRNLAVVQIGTGLALAGPDTMFPLIAGGFAGLLGSMALMLALAGLYGVLSHVVTARTREIGVRLAIGADAAAIRRMILREGLSPVLLGLVAGLGLSLILRAALQPLFLRLLPAAELTLMLFVPALFVAAGLAACYLPAIRASRVDPQVALRNL